MAASAATAKKARPAAAGTRKRRAAPPTPVVVQRRPWLALVLAAMLGLVAAAAVAVSAVRDDGATVEPSAVSNGELVELARTRETPIYWLGRMAGRKLELTTGADGAFVRYLPADVEVGADRAALTVATYPVTGAFANAEASAKQDGMVSRRTRNAGLAVWSATRPTSVYVAFQGVPHLIEVFAPNAGDARRLALSGRIRPVR